MPRSVPSALATHLASQTITLVSCYKVVRVDGGVLRYTSHDEDITLDGELYVSAKAAHASAISYYVNDGVDNFELNGMMAFDGLSEDELDRGLYENASLYVYRTNYASPSDGKILMFKGRIANVRLELGTGLYVAEVHSLMQRLKQATSKVTSATCRVKRFGDAQCNVPGGIAAYRFTRTITAVTNSKTFRFNDSHATNYFRYGIVRFTSGLNSGIEREVKSHMNSGSACDIVAREAFPFEVHVGDTAVLEAGCDRLSSTCLSRFANLSNFRGEHLLPGNAQIIKVGRGTG